MNAESITAVSAAVVAITQICKWSGIPDRWGPLLVLLLSAIGVGVWAFSQDVLPMRTDLFSYFAGWIVVAAAAAGVFGFTRAGAEAITRTKAPPTGGAGGSPTN